MLSRLPGLTRNKPIHLAYLLLRASKKCTKPIPSWRGFKPSLIPTTNTRECLSKGAGKDFHTYPQTYTVVIFRASEKEEKMKAATLAKNLKGTLCNI